MYSLIRDLILILNVMNYADNNRTAMFLWCCCYIVLHRSQSWVFWTSLSTKCR